MCDQKTTQETISSAGADIPSHVNETMQDVQPAMIRMGHRVKDELHHLSDSGSQQ